MSEGNGPGVRRLLMHLLVVIVVVTCVALGLWQLDRREQLEERNALAAERLAAEPRPYRELEPQLDPEAPVGSDADATHRPVVVAGSFDSDHEVLLRGRALEGQPGHHVLTPLLLDSDPASDGEAPPPALLVDRGWIPYAAEASGRPAHAPPAGRVQVTGRLMPKQDPPEGFLAGLAPRDRPTGRLATVARADIDRLKSQMPYALEPYWVQAEQVQAEQLNAEASAGDAAAGENGRFPVVPPPPGPEAGPHLGYALQWFSFAAIAAVGYVLLLRRTAREQASADPPHRE